MKPPYFGYFALDPKSKAKTFDECLQECDGDIDLYDTIETFLFFYRNEDADDFLDHTLFKIFCPEGETHDFYVYCGDEEDVILSNGKEYHIYAEWGVSFYPKDPDDFNDFLFKDIIEEEFEHLSSKYGHLFKKLTLEEFQDLLDNMNFPADVYVPSII